MAGVLLVLNGSTGGAALSARDLVKNLKRKGHRVYVACPPNKLQSPQSVFGEVADGTAEVIMPNWNKNDRMRKLKRPAYLAYQLLRSKFHLAPTLKLRSLIRTWKIDIVHTNTAVTIHGALAAKLTNTPHIWHIREEIGRDALFRFSMPESALARVFTGLSTRILTNSKFSQSFFRRNGQEAHTQVVYNGIDIGRFEEGSSASLYRQNWGGSEDTVLFGMIANVTSHFKRHDVFIRAAGEAIRNGCSARFVVIGFDPVQQSAYRSDLAYAQHLRQLVAAEGIEDHFVWAGYQSDTPAAINALDVVVHPCDREGFGRIAVEAMAASKPVIATRAGGLAEIVEDEITGVSVDAGEVSAFAQAMSSLCSDEGLRAEMGRKGHVRAKQKFSLENMVAQVDQIYEEIIAGS